MLMKRTIINEMKPLAGKRLHSIINNEVIDDDVIDYFIQLIQLTSNYEPFMTHEMQQMTISEVPRLNKHIQIIYSTPRVGDPNAIGHWVCSYYDTENLFIYDSLNRKYIHEQFRKVLITLHPYHFSSKRNILFPDVHQQTNGIDCGVFAISFAVSLLCGIKPDKIVYKMKEMRPHLFKMLQNRCIEHFPCDLKPIPISQRPKHIYDEQIMKGGCLNDLHIEFFQEMVRQLTFYRPCPTLYVQKPEKINQIPQDVQHIQILFQRGSEIGHWICTFYDSESLFIYDSLNCKRLQDDHICVLQKLHPYCFSKKENVIFKSVQQQSNGIDCGVFAIAFATSLLFGHRPDEILYQENDMRSHLIQIFKSRTIEHFKCYAMNKGNLQAQHSINKQPKRNLMDCENIHEKLSCDNLGCTKKMLYSSVVKANSSTIIMNNGNSQPQHFLNTQSKSNRNACENFQKKVSCDNFDGNNKMYSSHVETISPIFMNNGSLQAQHYFDTHSNTNRNDCENVPKKLSGNNSATTKKMFSSVVKTNNSQIMINDAPHHHSMVQQHGCVSQSVKKRAERDSRYYQHHKNEILQESKETYKKKTEQLDVISKAQQTMSRQSQYYQRNKEKILQRYRNKKDLKIKEARPNVTCTMYDQTYIKLTDTKQNLSTTIQTTEDPVLLSKEFTEENCNNKSIMNLQTQNILVVDGISMKRPHDSNDLHFVNDNSKKVKNINIVATVEASSLFNKKITKDNYKENSIMELEAQNIIVANGKGIKRQHDHSDSNVRNEKSTKIKNMGTPPRSHTNLDNLNVCSQVEKISIVIDKEVIQDTSIDDLIGLDTQNIVVTDKVNDKRQRQRKSLRAYNDDKTLYLKNKYSKLNSDRQRFNLKLVAAKIIRRKYTTIDIKQTTNKLLQNTELYVQRIMNKLNSTSTELRIEVENKVTASIYVRNDKILQVKKTLKNLKDKVELSLTRLRGISITGNERCALTALCNFFKHTSSSELYFSGYAYNFEENWFKSNMKSRNEVSEIHLARQNVDDTNKLHEALQIKMKNIVSKEEITMDNGQDLKKPYDRTQTEIANEEPRTEIPLNGVQDVNERGERIIVQSKEKLEHWQCTEYCKVADPDIIMELEDLFKNLHDLTYVTGYRFLKQIDLCSNSSHDLQLRGHPEACYNQPLLCKSKFLKLNVLSVHYPSLRTIKRIIYKLKYNYRLIEEVDTALRNNDFDQLTTIVNEARRLGITLQFRKNTDNEICLDEQKLKERFHDAIREYTALVIDPPSIPCISCERLFCARVLTSFNKLQNSSLKSEQQKNDVLENIKKLSNGNDTENFICRYCFTKVNKGEIPSLSVLNNLTVGVVPEELKCLNWFEKILIQRAKAFQTVIKMDTVMKKNLPHHVKIDKVRGRTFHLSLPLEETLKKICPETDPLNTQHELYILLRANPSKKKIIWEDYVDIKKVWKALFWLQNNNPIYEKIVLPSHPEQLLQELKDVQSFHEEKHEEETKAGDINTDGKSDSDDNETKKAGDSVKQAPFITQKSQSDSFYEQYTIYPLYGKRMNESDTKLYQMLQIYASALDVRGKDLDLKCFPYLYPYGKHGQGEQRDVHLREFDFVKHRLTSKHAQFRRDIQYLFYLLFNNNIRQVSAGIFHKMNVINPRQKYTAGELIKNLEQDQLESNLNTIFSRLRGTEAYWKKVRNDLNCMMSEYGPVTWFITLSPGEWMWSALGDYIRKVNSLEDDKRSISELVAFDPVSASRYIHNRFQATLKYILSSAHPIGKVAHYYYTCEYQGRGLPHFHCLFWIQNAPVYGKSSSEDVENFILQYITCRIPDKLISPELHRRVMSYQKHKHNDYCMRRKKTKTGFTCSCRFGFPRPVTKHLVLRDVSLAIANRSKLRNKGRFYDLPRSLEEQCINDYMPSILGTIWEGNMDAQYICESSYLLTKYVTSYSTKGEKSVLDFSDIQSNKSLCSRLWSFALRALNHREFGAIEAADVLLGHPLHATDPDTIIRWLDVNMIRSRKLKPFSEIRKMAPDSNDIFYESFIDSHYSGRPKELESLCLYDFAKWFDIIKNKPIRKAEYYEMSNGLFCKKRKNPYLINHWKYDPQSQPEAYYYALLLLFRPWRDTDELKDSEKTFFESFHKQQSTLADAMKYHDKCQTIKQAIDDMNKIIEKQLLEQCQTKTQANTNNIPEGCVPIEVENAMKDFIDLVDNNKIDNEQDLQLRIDKFNGDQSRVFNKITLTLKSSNSILRLFVSGSGGTGKSFIIENLVAWNRIARGKDTAVTAPTGIAAYNIGGLTIHRLLHLPVEHGCTAKYKQLSDAALKQIRQTLKNVDLIILDEVSMVSNVMLMYIHLRLTEIFDTSDCEDGWFGRINIVVFGDLLQLPPVHEEFAFVEMSKLKIEKYIGSMNTFNLWLLFDYDELTINMRQRNDKSYSEILSRIRLGLIIETDICTLRERRITFSKTNHFEVMAELYQYWNKLPDDTVCLLPTRNMCNILNAFMMDKIDGEEIVVIASDSFKSPKNLEKKIMKILDADENNVCGIDRIIKIKVGSRVMIRRNIDVSIGLVNGTIGKIVSVAKDKNNTITDIRIVLKSGKEYSIPRLEYKFIIMDTIYIIREQFPITNSYGITIHKSQGLSLENAIVEAGNSTFSNGQTYVALSRVTQIEGLHLINFDPSSCTADKLAILEYNRLRATNSSDIQPFQIPRTRRDMTCSRVRDIFNWKITVNTHDDNFGMNILCDDNWDIKGLPNNDNVSCYANASVQSLFFSTTLRRVLFEHTHNDFVKVIFNQYMSKSLVDMRPLRQFADDIFTSSVQQDASEFLNSLFNKSEILKNIIQHDLTIITRCSTCDTRSETIDGNFIMILPIPEQTRTYTLQEIINDNFDNWKDVEGVCSGCKSRLMTRTCINIRNTILIVQLLLFETHNGTTRKISNFKLKDIPKAKVTIHDKVYKITSAIFHHGNNLHSGHYTNMLRQKNGWLKVSDTIIEKKQWPKCAKDAYIFFLEQCHNKR